MEEREPSIARRLRSEYDDCTRQLENPWRSIKTKSVRLQWMLRILSEWFEHELHENKSIEPLVTERGIAAFNAALADVLPTLPLRSAI
jgi:hypothetical protein